MYPRGNFSFPLSDSNSFSLNAWFPAHLRIMVPISCQQRDQLYQATCFTLIIPISHATIFIQQLSMFSEALPQDLTIKLTSDSIFPLFKNMWRLPKCSPTFYLALPHISPQQMFCSVNLECSLCYKHVPSFLTSDSWPYITTSILNISFH